MHGRLHILLGCAIAISTAFVAASANAQRRPAPSNSNTRPAASGPQRAPQTQRPRTPKNRPAAGQRPAAQERNANPRIAQRNQPRPIQQPPGFPLSADEQERVDKILKFWEVNTSEVKTFRAEYQRLEYDPVMGPPDMPNTVVRGRVKYAMPDKGLMQDTKIQVFNPAAKGKKDRYIPAKNQHGEDWVCDGKSIFMKEPSEKLLVEQPLPPHLHGKAISQGPLPFLFGAKAETMKNRFWIREVTPKDNPHGNYFLEATPKTRQDRANYEKIVVELDKQDYLLPKKMEVTVRTFRPKPAPGKPVKTLRRIDIYKFGSRKVNDPADRVRGFFAKFVAPTVPKGWKRVKRDWMQTDDRPIARQPAPKLQARRKAGPRLQDR